jgi:hypothetical protein
MPRLARCNTDKIDVDKRCRMLKMHILSGEQTICPVTVPPGEIHDLRGLFTTYRLYKKQETQLKNRIHSLVKERLYPGRKTAGSCGNFQANRFSVFR